MLLIYNIGIYLYLAGIYIASFFNKKADLWIRGRKNWKVKLDNNISRLKDPVWFHCASLGEFEMVRPLIEKIRSEYPGQNIVLTFFSPSGYEVRKDYSQADVVMYLPLDTPGNAAYFLEKVQPVCALFAKYEFWHYFIDGLKKKSIPFYAVSAVFRSDHRFFKWYGRFFRNDLKKFTRIYVQENNSCELLKKINVDSVIAGDLRFDRVIRLASQSDPVPIIEEFINGRKVIIAGSSWEPEEKALSKLNPDKSICMIIAPHDISESHLAGIELLFPGAVRFSQAERKTIATYSTMIIDNIGMLGTLYKYGTIAIVGGGFTGKLHNILEAAVFGNVVMFGPLHKRFHEAQFMINAGGALVFKDDSELLNKIKSLLENNEKLQQMRNNAAAFVNDNKGAVDIIYPAIEKHIRI